MADPGEVRPPDPKGAVQKGGKVASSGNMKAPGPRSFVEVAKQKGGSRFPVIQLAPRQYGSKDGKPAVSFTAEELRVGAEHLKYSLIAKFSSGRPPIEEVRRALLASWSLVGQVSIGAWDARHVLIVLDSEQDACKVLANPVRKLGHYMFRVFRWFKDFSTKREPTTTTAWIRLNNLPPEMYNPGYIASIVSSFARFLAVDNRTIWFSNPSYARAYCDDVVREQLWEDLIAASDNINAPWIVSGDFNTISSWEEKQGGNLSDDGPLLAFNEFQLQAGLSDCGFKGPPFTWSNNQSGSGRIWERLDRSLVNGLATAEFPTLQVSHLERIFSDHCPILVELAAAQQNFGFFHYQRAWETHPGFHSFVTSCWRGHMHPDPLVNFGLKFKRLRMHLRKWNWEVFGDVRVKKRNLLLQVGVLEARLQQGWSSDLASELSLCKGQYQEVADLHNDMLKSKARLDWLEHGEHNSNLFHAAIKARRVKNRVQLELDDGQFTDDREVIGKDAADFYSNLFGGSVPAPPQAFFDILQPVVSKGDNEALCKKPNIEEVRGEIIEMALDSSPGPDGFIGRFYIHFWEEIKVDLMAAIEGFFDGLHLPCSFTSTYLTLIPKVAHATSISHLRPISLCNFCHKIISRILTSRLASWLPRIISEEQVGFVKGRAIHENIDLAHELTHDLNHKVFGGNLILKLDMAKAYDRVSWPFILGVLRSLGFVEAWCVMVSRCVTNCFYSVKWDGKLFGYFKSSRGVRQGDPLSPNLFVIAMEWLSRVLNASVDHGVVQPFLPKRRAVRVGHLLFADDLLIFTNGAKNSVRNLMDLIKNFCALSGQCLNPEKSSVIFPSSFPSSRQAKILSLTGFSEGVLPVPYLGAPLFRGRVRIDMFTDLVDKVTARIGGWMKLFLSMGGRVTLVNSILSAIGVHCMLVLPIPLTVLNRLSSLMANFIWDSGGSKRRHWKCWQVLCRSKQVGGLGIRDPKTIMTALHVKLAWSFLEQRTLWAKYCKARYRSGERGSGIWNAFSHLIPSLQDNSSWRLGCGDLSGDLFCWRLGIEVPESIKNHRIRDIVSNPVSRNMLLEVLPAREVHHLGLYSFGFGPDRCFWNDDSVSKLGIPIVSHCVCCHSPVQESLTHLFFEGEWGSALWKWLALWFNKPRVHSLKGFKQGWMRTKPRDFMSSMALGLACCGLWEIWKTRNTLIFEGKLCNWHFCVQTWGSNLACLLHKAKRVDEPWLRAVGFHAGTSHRHWTLWKPGIGRFTLNVAVVSRGRLNGGGGFIARDRRGCMCFGGAFQVPNSIAFGLPWLIDKALAGNALQPPSWSVQSSHPAIRDLSNASWEDVPVEVVYMGRRMTQHYGINAFHKICALSNGAALSLAWQASTEGLIPHNLFPAATRLAISGDKAQLPQRCQGDCDASPGRFPSRTRDDADAREPHHRLVFQDDTFAFCM
ncbi:hypothetical protein QQ045_020251 [Rhodiola kirilowii]